MGVLRVSVESCWSHGYLTAYSPGGYRVVVHMVLVLKSSCGRIAENVPPASSQWLDFSRSALFEWDCICMASSLLGPRPSAVSASTSVQWLLRNKQSAFQCSTFMVCQVMPFSASCCNDYSGKMLKEPQGFSQHCNCAGTNMGYLLEKEGSGLFCSMVFLRSKAWLLQAITLC